MKKRPEATIKHILQFGSIGLGFMVGPWAYEFRVYWLGF